MPLNAPECNTSTSCTASPTTCMQVLLTAPRPSSRLHRYIQELLRLADNLANGTIPRSDLPPVDFTDRIVQTADRPTLEEPPAGTAFGNVSLDGQPRSTCLHMLTTAPRPSSSFPQGTSVSTRLPQSRLASE